MVTFRYSFAGQFDAGLLTVTFIEGAWDGPGTNAGQETVQQIGIITEAQSFFIELSGGVILQAANLFDEPLIEIFAEVIIELDFVREVFSLSLSGQLNVIKLGTVGATAGKFVLDNSGELSSSPQFWGVLTLETNFQEFEQFGIFFFVKGTLQINTTAFEKTETLTLKGLADDGGDLTRTFVLPAQSFLLEVLGQLVIRPPGTDTDLARLEGGFLISINPNRIDIFATVEMSFGVGDAMITYGEAIALLIIRTGGDGANPGVAGYVKVGSSADVGLPDVGGVFSASGEVTVMFNTTLEEQVFVIPDSFQPLLEDDGISEIPIFAAAPRLNGTRNDNALGGEIYFSVTIAVKLNILDALILEGYIQITLAISPEAGTARFSVTGAVTAELNPIGALSGTLNLIIFVGEKTGVVGRVQLALASDQNSPFADVISIRGDLLLEINAVLDLSGDDLLQPVTIETFLIDTDTGKFLRDELGNPLVGDVEIEPGVLFELSGEMTVASILTLEGRFKFKLSPDIFEVEVEARLLLDPFGSLEVIGGIRIDDNGLVLVAELSLDVGFGADIGIGFQASAILHVNTTGAVQTLAGVDVNPGLKIRIEGKVEFLSFASGSGFVEINITDTAFTLEFGLNLNIGTEALSFRVAGFAGVFADDNPGLVLDLQIEVSVNFAVIALEASGVLRLNTTDVARTGAGGQLVEANSFRLRLFGTVSVVEVIKLEADVEIFVSNNGWRVSLNNLELDMFLFRVQANGFIDSDGQFDLNLNASFNIGVLGISGNFHIFNTVSFDGAGNPIYNFGVSVGLTIDILFGLISVSFNASLEVNGNGDVPVKMSGSGSIKIAFFRITKRFTIDLGIVKLPPPVFMAAGVRNIGDGQLRSTWNPAGFDDLDNSGIRDNGEVQGQLTLNVGSRAGNRNISEGQTNELFIIEAGGFDDEGRELTRVKALGRSNSFANVTSIVADFGGGDDILFIAPDIDLAVFSVNLGGGQDLLDYQGSPDGAVDIFFDGGAELDIMQWLGSVADSALVPQVRILGGLGPDSITLLGGAARVEGGGGGDTIIGSNDDGDMLFGDNPDGSGGVVDAENNNNDEITARGGGTGQVLNGGVGEDTFVVTLDDLGSTIDGGSGIDTIELTTTGAADSLVLSEAAGVLSIARALDDLRSTGVEKVTIFTLSGADTVRIEELGPSEVDTVVLDLGNSRGDGSADTVLIVPDQRGPASVLDTSFDDAFILTQIIEDTEMVGVNVQRTLPDAATPFDVQIVGSNRVVDGANQALAGDRLIIRTGGGKDLIDASRLQTIEVVTFEDGSTFDVEADDLLVFEFVSGDGDDVLIGSMFDDILNSGRGSDTVTGGPGLDTFIDSDTDGVDNDGDGLIDEDDEHNDGEDRDGDGIDDDFVDNNSNGIFDAGDTQGDADDGIDVRNDVDTLVERLPDGGDPRFQQLDLALFDRLFIVGTIKADNGVDAFISSTPVEEGVLIEEIKNNDDPSAVAANNPLQTLNTGDHWLGGSIASGGAVVEEINGIFEEALLTCGNSKNIMVVGDRDGTIFIGSEERNFVGDWTGVVRLDNGKDQGTGDGPPPPEVYILNVTGCNGARMAISDTGGGEGFDLLIIAGTNGPDRLTLDAQGTGPNAVDFVFVSGPADQDGKDDLITFRGVERVEVSTFGGADSVLSNDTVTTTILNLGGGDDEVTVGTVPLIPDTGNRTLEFPEGVPVADTDNMTNGNTAPLFILGEGQNDRMEVNHNRAKLYLHGGAGDDRFLLKTFLVLRENSENQEEVTNLATVFGGTGSNRYDYLQNAPVFINGGPGIDTIVVTGTPIGDIFIITDTLIAGAGRITTFTNIEAIEVDGGGGPDQIYVLSTNALFSTSVIGGSGDDIIHIGGAPPPLILDPPGFTYTPPPIVVEQPPELVFEPKVLEDVFDPFRFVQGASFYNSIFSFFGHIFNLNFGNGALFFDEARALQNTINKATAMLAAVENSIPYFEAPVATINGVDLLLASGAPRPASDFEEDGRTLIFDSISLTPIFKRTKVSFFFFSATFTTIEQIVVNVDDFFVGYNEGRIVTSQKLVQPPPVTVDPPPFAFVAQPVFDVTKIAGRLTIVGGDAAEDAGDKVIIHNQ